jgi:hypothetical protein
VVKQPSFHRRLKAELDLVEGVEVEEAVAYIQVGGDGLISV